MLPGTVYVCILVVVEMQSDGWPYIHNYVSLSFLSSTFLISFSTQLQNKMMLAWFFFWGGGGPQSLDRHHKKELWGLFFGHSPSCLYLLSTCRHMMSLHTLAYWKRSTAGGVKSLRTCYSSSSSKWFCDFWNSARKGIVWGALLSLKLVARMQVVWFWDN